MNWKASTASWQKTNTISKIWKIRKAKVAAIDISIKNMDSWLQQHVLRTSQHFPIAFQFVPTFTKWSNGLISSSQTSKVSYRELEKTVRKHTDKTQKKIALVIFQPEAAGKFASKGNSLAFLTLTGSLWIIWRGAIFQPVFSKLLTGKKSIVPFCDWWINSAMPMA